MRYIISRCLAHSIQHVKIDCADLLFEGLAATHEHSYTKKPINYISNIIFSYRM